MIEGVRTIEIHELTGPPPLDVQLSSIRLCPGDLIKHLFRGKIQPVLLRRRSMIFVKGLILRYVNGTQLLYREWRDTVRLRRLIPR